jgi:predicted N-formylglutamate amidohydrolase
MGSSAVPRRKAGSSPLTLDRVVLSCEHARNRVPQRYAPLFSRAKRALGTHRGYDIGALPLACYLEQQFEAPLFTGNVTRLIVDLNRSLGHPQLHSSYLAPLAREERREVIERYYRPYREAVEVGLARRIASGAPVLHLGVHSFVPVLGGDHRNADVGLMYDPGRRTERTFALRWQSILSELAPELRVRRNYPYRGVGDGFIPFLRRRFPARNYVGLQLEVNQAGLQTRHELRRIGRIAEESLRRLLSR